ncbi:MAG: hypothetical protein ACOZAM_15095 [Pseudomonadota bacterium]
MGLTAELRLKFKARQTGANDLGTPEFNAALEAFFQFANGTGADQADLLFADSRNVLASSNDDIDLAGSLSSVYGTTITAAEMVALIIKNKSTTQTLTVGAGSNPWISWLIATGDGIKIPPRGAFMLVSPDAAGLGAVVAATGDILRVANGSGSAADYDIAFLARSA